MFTRPLVTTTVTTLFGLWLLVSFPLPTFAEVGDPTLQTDHPQYAGEGAFQTVSDCVRFATRDATTPQDKALAMYQWMLTHQWHLPSPQEPYLAGLNPDTKQTENYDLMVTDANRARFSYGYGLCGTVHAWNEPYWRGLQMNARRRAFPGHTNSEIEYDGTWHTFDTDMAGLVFRKDGVVAGYADIQKQPDLILHARPPLPCYPFDWPNDFQAMQQGWREVAKGGEWFKMYNGGHATHPAIVQLRAGETFTRYFDRDHFGGPTKRRFWHHESGGPFRNWTFANNGVPEHQGERANCRGNISYANGEFVYEPDLIGGKFLEGVSSYSPNLIAASKSPHLRSKDGAGASCTFFHFSPYVICGDPVDDANPMTGRATDGCKVRGAAVGVVQCDVSTDQGQMWHTIGELRGPFEHDLTEFVKGHYGWSIRFRWSGDSGLEKLRFETTTQVCATIYPRLRPSGSHVTYRCASRAVVPVLPNLGLNEEATTVWEEKPLRSANLKYSPRNKQTRAAFTTTNNKPAHVVIRVVAPRDLLEISAAARFSVRVPPPENCDFRQEFSLDGGKSWQLLSRAIIPTDNEHSSGWMSGGTDASTTPSKTALIRLQLYAGGYQTGLLETQAYGTYRTARPQALKITYGWKEGDVAKLHVEEVPANTERHKFVVPTGATIKDDFVRMEVP